MQDTCETIRRTATLDRLQRVRPAEFVGAERFARFERMRAALSTPRAVVERNLEVSIAQAFEATMAPREAHDTRNYKLYVNTRAIEDQRYFAKPCDGSFLSYAQRLEYELQSETFLYLAAGVRIELPRAAMGWLVDSCGPLQHSAPSSVLCDIFVGRYEFTPGGVHLEVAPNFHSVLHGQKEMWFWSGDCFWNSAEPAIEQIDPVCGDYELFVPELDPLCEAESAEKLVASAGQSFWWSEDTWHVGRSPTLSITASFVVF